MRPRIPLALLREVAGKTPRAEDLVEETETIEEARRLLAEAEPAR